MVKAVGKAGIFFLLFHCIRITFIAYIYTTDHVYNNNIAYKPHFIIGFDLNMNPHMNIIKSIDTCPKYT